VELNIKLAVETINFYKAISNIYLDKQYGRLVQVNFLDPNGDEDAVLVAEQTQIMMPVIARLYLKLQNGTPRSLNLEVSGVAVRLDSKVANETISNEIGFEPKTDWSTNKFCGVFYFTQTADHQVHYGVINDLLTRAK
jgi:hypothetical protein